MKSLRLFCVRYIESFKLILGKYPDMRLKLYYDTYWDSKRKNDLGKLTDFQYNRVKVIENYLENNKSLKDVGCGDGGPLLYLKKKKKFTKIYGLDTSDKVLESLSKKGLDTKKIDINDVDKIKKYPKTDYTLVLELLEHLPNSEEVLLELMKTTNNKLIFSVPNTGYFAHRKRLLLGSFPLQWRTSPNEHLRFWTLRDMKWWLRQLNLYEKSEIKTYEGLPGLNRIWPGMFAQGLIVIIKK